MTVARDWLEIVSLISFFLLIISFALAVGIDCSLSISEERRRQCMADRDLIKLSVYIPFISFRFLLEGKTVNMPEECARALYFMASGYILLICYRNSDIYLLPFGLKFLYDFYGSCNKPCNKPPPNPFK